MHKKNVVVVGAGFAGVSAARTLLAESLKPIDVTILEASTRVGGRACTREIQGCGKVELGATWFHGIVGNPLYEHAVQLGIMPRHEAENSNSSWGAVKYVRQNEAALLSEADAAIVAKARDLYGEAVEASLASAPKGSTGVVGDTVRQAFAQAVETMDQEPDRSKALFTEAWAWREQLQRAMDGCHSTDDMSAYSLAQYEEFEGPNIPLPSGYQTLAEKLAEGLPIRHGVVVDRIQWGGDGVTLHCQGGEQIKADAVIVTVSLGVLKAQHKHMFEPRLPHATVRAIDRLGFGVVDKLFIDFGPSAPASPDSAQQDLCQVASARGSNADQSRSEQQHDSNRTQTTDAASEGVKGSVQPLTANEAVSYYLLWNRDLQDFQPATPLQHDPVTSTSAETGGRDPLRNLHELSNSLIGAQQGHRAGSPAAKGAGDKGPETHVVTASTHEQQTTSESASYSPGVSMSRSTGSQLVLPTWARGAYTLRFAGSEFVQETSEHADTAANRCGVVWITGEDAQKMEDTSEKELHDSIAAILQQFPALQLPRQFRVHRSCWGSDPLFHGSYSYGSASATGGEFSALCEPLVTAQRNDRTLKALFAGEACHPQYFGCTHGAYLTGRSQAQKLLKSWPSCNELPD